MEMQGTTKPCIAIHGLLVNLIYDWLGALDDRRGHVNGRCAFGKWICVLQSCKTRC